MQKFTEYWKGILAFITPGVTLLVVAVTEASPSGSAVTGAEWVGIGAAMVITGGAVTFGPANTPPASALPDDPYPEGYEAALEIDEDEAA